MAISSNIQHKKEVTVYIGTEITMGTATLAAGTWYKMDIIDYSISEISAPLEVAGARSGLYGQGESMAKHRRDQQMYDIELQMYGGAASIDRICGALFEDSNGTNALLGSSPTTTIFKDSAANGVPVTILFENGGSGGNDLWFISCLCTKLSLSYGLGDGGSLKLTAGFTTGYDPVEGTLTPTTSTDTYGKPFNFHDLSTHTLDAADLLLSDVSLDISRSVSRVGYDSATYKPLKYTIGQYEVSGSLSCKRDSNSDTVTRNSSVGVVLALSDGTFKIDAPDVMVSDVSSDTAEDGWKSTFNFKCFFNDATTVNPIVTITTVAE